MEFKGPAETLYKAEIAYFWLEEKNEMVFQKLKDTLHNLNKYETPAGIMNLLASKNRTLIYGKDGSIIAKNW